MNKNLLLIIYPILLTGCLNMNMKKQPDKWVTILDVNTNKPVPSVPLVYTSIKKPYFIVGELLVSRQYVSDENGEAYIPSDIRVQTAVESNYSVVVKPTKEKKNKESTEIIYVELYE